VPRKLKGAPDDGGLPASTNEEGNGPTLSSKPKKMQMNCRAKWLGKMVERKKIGYGHLFSRQGRETRELQLKGMVLEKAQKNG